MPHKRHRVRVHVHNRYVRTQPAQQNKCCKKRCRNGSRCRRGGDEPSRQEDDCDRVIIAGPDAPRGCQRFHSAEEVCRKGCGGARGSRSEDQRAATERTERYGGYESPDGDRDPCKRDPCNRCGKARTAGGGCGCDKRGGGGSRPGTPCERFKSAEETCRSCPKRPGDRQRYRDTGGGGGQRNFTVYTAQVQQLEFSGKPYPTQVAQETTKVTQPVAIPPCGKTSKFPPCPDPGEITEEIIHTREHRWHIPSARQLAAAYPCDPPPADPCDPPPCDRESVARRRGPCSSSSSLGSVPRSRRTPLPVGEPGGVRRTRSELLAGRELVSRIARQVELDDGAGHQLVYRLSAQYTGVGQFADYSEPDSGSESERPPLPSEHGTERSTQTAETVRRLTLLRLSDVSVTASSSDGGLVINSASPRPAPRSARPAEPPAPLPRRQVTSEPALPAPTAPAPAPATRTTRSLDCQPVPVEAGDGRTKRLRTRGALTRLRQRSVTRLNEERHRQLLNERPVTQIMRQPAGKSPPDRPSDTDNERRDVTILYAQNLLPNDYQGGPGSRGDAAAAEPIYQNVDALYDTAAKPADGAGYSGGGGGGGGGFEPVDPGSASPYLNRAADPYQPDAAADDRYSVAGRSPYLDTSPTGRSARARFDDDDELGAALYEQRYQPRRDSSPYLSRPTGRAADPVPAQTGAPLQRQGAPLQRQGGQQQLGAAGRRGQGIGQRLTSGFTSLRQRGAALYRKLSGGRGRGAAAGRGRGRGRGATAASQPVGRSGTAAKGRRSGGADGCSCTDSDSDCGAVNCSFLFYFNGDGGPSPFMSNIPGAITGAGGAQRGGAGSMPRKYCGMCD